MTTKCEIEIEGLPAGWKIDKISICQPDYVTDTHMTWIANVFLEKIKPIRIALEETEENAGSDEQHFLKSGVSIGVRGKKIWREVKEDSLNKELEELAVEHSKDWNKGR